MGLVFFSLPPFLFCKFFCILFLSSERNAIKNTNWNEETVPWDTGWETTLWKSVCRTCWSACLNSEVWGNDLLNHEGLRWAKGSPPVPWRKKSTVWCFPSILQELSETLWDGTMTLSITSVILSYKARFLLHTLLTVRVILCSVAVELCAILLQVETWRRQVYPKAARSCAGIT